MASSHGHNICETTSAMGCIAMAVARMALVSPIFRLTWTGAVPAPRIVSQRREADRCGSVRRVEV